MLCFIVLQFTTRLKTRKMIQKATLILLVITFFSCESKKAEKENASIVKDSVSDKTVKNSDPTFNESYFIEKTFTLDLDHDQYLDTIQLLDIRYKNVKTKETFDDHGYRKIKLSNKKGTTIIENQDAWGISVNVDSIENIILENDEFNFIIFPINKSTNGILFSKYQYGSDYEYYTLFKVDSLSKPIVSLDSSIRINKIKDVNQDGITEIIGVIGYDNIDRLGFIKEELVKEIPYHVLTIKNNKYKNDDSLFYSFNQKFYDFREFPESSLKKLTEKDLKNRTQSELRIMRNELYAQYGYIFTSEDLNEYFSSKNWYKARQSNVRAFDYYFTDIEKYNIGFIKSLED